MLLLPLRYGAMGSRQTSTFRLYHICIHTFNTTLTLTEIKKRHNLHCRRVLIQVMNQRTLSCAHIVCVSFYSVWYVFTRSLYIITLCFFFSPHASQNPRRGSTKIPRLSFITSCQIKPIIMVTNKMKILTITICAVFNLPS